MSAQGQQEPIATAFGWEIYYEEPGVYTGDNGHNEVVVGDSIAQVIDLIRCARELEIDMERSKAEAMAEWPAEKERREREAYQAECPHDESDHGICLDCGVDTFEDILSRAEDLRDRDR